MLIGEQIRALRSQKKITQEILAAEMGVTVGAVSKWESGTTLPDVQMLCSLADYFEVTTDKLLGRAYKGSFAVCDDAEFIRETIKGIMEKEGYTCAGLVGSGTQLREIFGTTPPDILFLDIHLGEENGLELLRELKENTVIPESLWSRQTTPKRQYRPRFHTKRTPLLQNRLCRSIF